MKIILVIATFLAATLNAQDPSAAAAAAGAGHIQGTVVSDPDKSILSGITVNVFRIGSVPPFSASVVTAADGTFNLSGLPDGNYGICTNKANGAFVDQCQWRDLQTTVNLRGGQTISAVVIRVKKSSILTVRVNDTAQALVKKQGETAAAHVLVGAFDLGGVFHPASEVAKDSNGVGYQLSIPVDFPVRLTVYSQKVQLQDSRQVPVASAGFYKVVAQPSGQTPQLSFTFSAVGRNP